MNEEKIFKKGIELHNYANTAYPLDGRKVFKDYKISNGKVKKIAKEEWDKVKELGLYVHIPFCESRCKYCEYSVLSGEELQLEEEYVSLLLKEIKMYKELFGEKKKAVGFDIGGGTPTFISSENIKKIKDAVLENYNLSEDFSMSIETTPKIAANDFQKLKEIRDMGIERISMGMQTISPKMLEKLQRDGGDNLTLVKAKNNIKDAGFERYNIDIMYGFANQTAEEFAPSVKFAVELEPEYITLYRMRYKGTKIEKDSENVSLEEVNKQYDAAFSLLTEAGYDANIGKNTFSKVKGDPGTSAYLTKRVVEGTPYLGMGLGAQNFSLNSIYYNEGAASKRIGGYRKKINSGELPIQDLYLLPVEESMAKMICVSFYFGSINMKHFKNRFGRSLDESFPEEIMFLENNDIMENFGDEFRLTKKGKDCVNGIIPLFYSQISKENLLNKIII